MVKRRAPPAGFTVLATVTQQKTLKMLTRARHDLPDDAAQPDQVTHGFIGCGSRIGGLGHWQISQPVLSRIPTVFAVATPSAIFHGDETKRGKLGYCIRDVSAADSILREVRPCDLETAVLEASVRHVFELNSVQRANAMDGQRPIGAAFQKL